MKQEKYTITACAKINIGLDVGEKRADGYHEIATLMQNISLADRITVCKNSVTNVFCSEKSIPSGRDNIAFKALKELGAYVEENIALDVEIEKYIPSQAGLGGGSADAAAVLIAANDIYSLDLSKPQLAEIGANVGSDVPFFIYGGSAIARGRGERITPLKSLKCENILIVKPQIAVSTKDAYEYLDTRVPAEYFSSNFENACAAVAEKRFTDLNSLIKNDFEEMLLARYPETTAIKEKLLSLNAGYVALSGSGSAFYALFDNSSDAQNAFCEIKKNNGAVYLCSFSDRAVFSQTGAASPKMR